MYSLRELATENRECSASRVKARVKSNRASGEIHWSRHVAIARIDTSNSRAGVRVQHGARSRVRIYFPVNFTATRERTRPPRHLFSGDVASLLSRNDLSSWLSAPRRAGQLPESRASPTCVRVSDRVRQRERRSEIETHLRAATRSCDLRRPCAAAGRSGGRRSRHFYMRRGTKWRSTRDCSVVAVAVTSLTLSRGSESRVPRILPRNRRDRKRGSVPCRARARARECVLVIGIFRGYREPGGKGGRRRSPECR